MPPLFFERRPLFGERFGLENKFALAFVELVFLLTVFVAPGSFKENVTIVKTEGAVTQPVQ